MNVGTDHDTGAFAVASIRGWWRFEGGRLYPKARNIVITMAGEQWFTTALMEIGITKVF